MIKLQKIALIAGLVLTFSALIGGVWAGADALGVRPATIGELRDHTIRIANLEADKWHFLNKKKQSPQGLTTDEFREWCSLGLRLGFIKECD